MKNKKIGIIFFMLLILVSFYVVIKFSQTETTNNQKLDFTSLFKQVYEIKKAQVEKNYEKECFLPKFTPKSDNNDIKLMYQRAECRLDTFNINSNTNVLELKNALKSHFKIDRTANTFYKLFGETHVYDKRIEGMDKEVEIDSFKILSREILITTKHPILDTLRGVKSSQEFLIKSFASEILKDIKKQLLENQINIDIYMGCMNAGTVSTSVSYIKDKTSKLNEEYYIQDCLNKINFSQQKIPVLLRDKNSSSIRNFILDKKTMSLKTYNVDVTILGDEKQTLKQAGLTNLDVIHHFTIKFVIFYKK